MSFLPSNKPDLGADHTMVKPCIRLKTKSKEQFSPHLVNFKNDFVDEKSFIRTRERLFISRFQFVECGNVVKY